MSGVELMGDYTIKKGFDIDLDGRPSTTVSDLTGAKIVGVRPLELQGIRWRLLVEEGTAVKRGTALLEDKKNPDLKLCAPAAGKIISITRGERRFVDRILIEVDAAGEAEAFTKYDSAQIATLSRDEVIAQLKASGYLAYLIERPFGRLADVSVSPKSIFVNAMNTGPFLVDASVVADAAPEALQAGIDAIAKLTDGKVHLCVGANASKSLTDVSRAEVHSFKGPHPAGNTSVHISKVDPMIPTDVVWTVKAVDLVQIGKLFLNGELPATRIVSLGGNCVNEDAAQHYEVLCGSELAVFADNVEDGEVRYISGDVLSGEKVAADDVLGLYQSSLTVIAHSEERHFMGWAMPGITDYSYSRTFVSSLLDFFFGRKLVADVIGKSICRLTTNTNGGKRAMVLTGYYDKVMPMDIMVDFLIRAVLANDTDEAIKLGILETLPEDFALCDFICPSKMEVQGVIRKGLEMIEEEGI